MLKKKGEKLPLVMRFIWTFGYFATTAMRAGVRSATSPMAEKRITRRFMEGKLFLGLA
jgi:hypothetical protein